jgi:putative peptidoglycan binding protein
MASHHTVVQGEHLSGIAAKFGFSTFRTLWNHPENAELKRVRQDPNILFPGDLVFIPDKEPKEESRATEKKHVFEKATEILMLRVKVLDQSDAPIHDDCSLVTASRADQMPQAGDIYETEISPTITVAKLDFPITPEIKARPVIDIAVGSLDPLDTLHGQQQRLNNLGYFAGFAKKEKSDEQLQWAIEEFQRDHPPLAVDGKLGSQTLAKLKQTYGC